MFHRVEISSQIFMFLSLFVIIIWKVQHENNANVLFCYKWTERMISNFEMRS
jgi:hypothetical protein